jgi:hypothetical protein
MRLRCGTFGAPLWRSEKSAPSIATTFPPPVWNERSTGSLLRELNKGRERSFGSCIERLDLADNVGFRFVLSVKAVDYCNSKGRACEH